MWQSFVELCVHGYQYSTEDYYEDLKVRDNLQALLDDGRIRGYSQYADLLDEVEKVDLRFKAALHPQVIDPSKPWWESRVPAKSGPDLAEAIAAEYGLQLEVVGDN